MLNFFWKVLAFILSRKPISRAIIEYAKARPWSHITSRDGTEIYMERYSLFNPQAPDNTTEWPMLPTIRAHKILRADDDAHLHDHPWDARNILLNNWYREERYIDGTRIRHTLFRRRGYTGRLNFGEFHRISEVPADGVWTLFITFGHRGAWGFDVSGKKIESADYFRRLQISKTTGVSI